MDSKYKTAAIRVGVRALKLARVFARSRSPIYVDGPVVRTLEENPDLDRAVLRAYLNQFGKQAFETRIAQDVVTQAKVVAAERLRKERGLA